MGKRIALFDFDGTLTRNDTFMDFHAARFGRARVLASLISALFRAGCPVNRDALKEAFIAGLWAGTKWDEYLSSAKDYSKARVEKNLLPLAMRVFMRHIELGDDVFIVTASIKDWVQFWAMSYGVPVIGTELEVLDGVLTGRLATPNCRGAEKVRRIQATVDLKSYPKIFAYGNSGGDREMLAIADEAVYRWNREPEL